MSWLETRRGEREWRGTHADAGEGSGAERGKHCEIYTSRGPSTRGGGHKKSKASRSDASGRKEGTMAEATGRASQGQRWRPLARARALETHKGAELAAGGEGPSERGGDKATRLLAPANAKHQRGHASAPFFSRWGCSQVSQAQLAVSGTGSDALSGAGRSSPSPLRTNSRRTRGHVSLDSDRGVNAGV